MLTFQHVLLPNVLPYLPVVFKHNCLRSITFIHLSIIKVSSSTTVHHTYNNQADQSFQNIDKCTIPNPALETDSMSDAKVKKVTVSPLTYWYVEYFIERHNVIVLKWAPPRTRSSAILYTTSLYLTPPLVLHHEPYTVYFYLRSVFLRIPPQVNRRRKLWHWPVHDHGVLTDTTEPRCNSESGKLLQSFSRELLSINLKLSWRRRFGKFQFNRLGA